MTDTLDPDAQTIALVAADIRALVGQLKRRLREQGGTGDLTPSQTSALSRLEREGPMTVSALARAEGVRPQSMGPIVAALEAAGFVAGGPDPTDGRQTLLQVTPECRAWIHAERAARQDWLARRIRHELDPAELADLARGVALLKRIADA